MNNTRIIRLAALSAALVFAACGGGTKKCTSNADCASGQICNTSTGQCTGGTGGGTGGGATGGGTGGGSMGGGTGGGATGGGTGGGSTGGGMGGGAGGGTMQVDGGTIAGGETCDMAAALTSGSVTFTGTTTGLMSDYDLARDSSGSGCNGYSSHPGADTVYQLSVPARSTVSVSVQGIGGDGTSMTMPIYDPSIYLVASPPSNCATATADGGVMATCIAASEDPFNSAADLLLPESFKWTNFDATASDVYLVIESGWAPAASQEDTDGDGTPDTWVIGQGDYSVVVTTTALPPPPANDTCATAVTLTGSAMNGTTQGAAADLTFDANSTCIDTSGLGDVFYTAVVQPGMRLTVDATTQAANTAIGINLFEGACSAVASCVTAVSQMAGTAASAYYDNRGTADITVMVSVATNDQDNLGADFTITGAVASIPPPPGNDACTAPATLSAATSTMGTISGATSEMLFGASPTGCNDGQGGADMKDVYYTLLVPAGQRATVVVTPSAALDPVVNVTDAPGTCTGVTACVASADSGSSGDPETVRYDNTTGADVTLLIQVGSWDGTEGTFDIQATLGAIPPPPANDTCAAPTALTSGVQVTGTTVSAAADSPYTMPTGCTATSTAKKDVYYTLQVGAGQTATVVVTPTGALATTLDPFINAYDSMLGCSGVAMCLANADSGFEGDPETLMYTNSGAAAVTLMIQVGVWYGAEGDFTVLATVQ